MNTIKLPRISFVKEIVLEPLIGFVPNTFFVNQKKINSNWSSSNFPAEEIDTNNTFTIEEHIIDETISSGICLGFENLIVFTHNEMLRVIAQLITKQPNGESEGSLVTNGCPNVFFSESKLYGRRFPFTALLYWLQDEKQWFLTGMAPFYTNDSMYYKKYSKIFVQSGKNILPDILNLRDQCIEKVKSIQLPDELEKELVHYIYCTGNDSLPSIMGDIVEIIQVKASDAMNLVCKYRGEECEKNLWKKYSPLSSAWSSLVKYFSEVFPGHILSKRALKPPDQI